MEEMLEVVDENNKVIGTEMRGVIIKKNLLRRAVALLILRGDDEVMLSMRSHERDINPDCWSFSVAGHMKPGERPDDAIRRETREELGREVGAEYFRLFRPVKQDHGYFIYVYISRLKAGSAIPGFDVRESMSLRFWKKQEILEAMKGKEKFSPNFRRVFRWLVDNGKI